MFFLFEGIRDLFMQSGEATKDKLGAYPERIHVRALPERRYLKTARMLTIAILMSFALNVAIAFVIMYISPRMTTTIMQGNNSQIFQMDKFFKEVEVVPNSTASLNPIRLAQESEIVRFVRELFTVLPNKDDMDYIWGPAGFLSNAVDLDSLYLWKQSAFDYREQGVNTEVIIRAVNYTTITKMYEIVFDVFFLNNSDAIKRICPCTLQTSDCETCLKAESFKVERYKMAVRPGFKSVREQVVNPYGLSLVRWTLFRLPIYDPEKPEEKAEAEWNDYRLAR